MREYRKEIIIGLKKLKLTKREKKKKPPRTANTHYRGRGL